MNKQELISKLENNYEKFPTLSDGKWVKLGYAIKIIQQLDEPQKVKVPAFVAEYFNYCIANERTLAEALSGLDRDFKIPDYLYPAIKWLEDSINQNIFAQAWLYGYEVEEEPEYLVRVNDMYFLNWGEDGTCPTFVLDDMPGSKALARKLIKADAVELAKHLGGTFEKV